MGDAPAAFSALARRNVRAGNGSTANGPGQSSGGNFRYKGSFLAAFIIYG